jgi:hypothetical protein
MPPAPPGKRQREYPAAPQQFVYALGSQLKTSEGVALPRAMSPPCPIAVLHINRGAASPPEDDSQ